jgi:hypothetical protein
MAYSDQEQALRVASAISAVATGCCLRYGLLASILRQPVTNANTEDDPALTATIRCARSNSQLLFRQRDEFRQRRGFEIFARAPSDSDAYLLHGMDVANFTSSPLAFV